MDTTHNPGYFPDTDEFDVIGACQALGRPGRPISRSTLDRWIPRGTKGRRMTRAGETDRPEIRFSADLIKSRVPTPGGDAVE